MPGLLFVPLLLRSRSLVPLLLFCAVLLAIDLPWINWDAPGFLYNGVLWPLYMRTDPTSWQFFAPHWTVVAVRAAVLAALAVLWLRYVLANEERMFWTLAVSNVLVLLASGFLRNGYVPWASLWVVAAIAEAFSARDAGGPPAEGALLAFNTSTAGACGIPARG